VEITPFELEDLDDFNHLMEKAWIDSYAEDILNRNEIRQVYEVDFTGYAEMNFLLNVDTYFPMSVREKDEVVGHVSVGDGQASTFSHETGEVFLLYIYPGLQGRGYGSAAMKSAERFLEEEWGKDYAGLEVFEDNEAAKEFYRGRGYEMMESIRVDPEGSPWLCEEKSMELMRKPL
jgi:ribosomal protein S18 acetylase RimI-like enzyme